MKVEKVLAKIEALPEESRRALLTLLDQLAEQSDQALPNSKQHVFKFDWEGGLSDAFPGLTAVELQHQANEWR